MNMWIMKLSYACKKKQYENCQIIPVPRGNVNESANKFLLEGNMNKCYFTDSSVVESPILSNIITNSSNYIEAMTAHAYIRLKDCSSKHSLGSSSASLSSSIASSSTLSENLSFKKSFLIPPPIPPKPNRGSRIQKSGKQVFKSDKHILEQPATFPDVNGTLSVKEEEWSNETVRPVSCYFETLCHVIKAFNLLFLTPFFRDTVGSINSDRTFLSFHSSTPTVFDSSVPKPLPRRLNLRNIPPEVDRSCKPNGIGYVAVSNGQKTCNTDDWKTEVFAASSRFLRSNLSHQQSLHAVVTRNKQISVGQEALYDNESMRTKSGTLDYLDPVKEPLVQSQSFIKSSQRPKIRCATEYTQIDEESTKVSAVLKANVRQNEMRRNGFPV
uniref:Uncharacterized protein n=1 Tax=Wuchereria bancrofti TaxID=6293 RepID=A0A1I8EEA4_WUCBA